MRQQLKRETADLHRRLENELGLLESDAERIFQLPHVFERYWKAQSTSQAGSGLGLYIASGIVEAHGGKIWAESSADGSRFTFILPLVR